MQEVINGMREKGISNLGWVDREMTKENKTLGAERCDDVDTLYINKKYN